MGFLGSKSKTKRTEKQEKGKGPFIERESHQKKSDALQTWSSGRLQRKMKVVPTTQGGESGGNRSQKKKKAELTVREQRSFP